MSQTPLPKSKFEIRYTRAKAELFSHCYKNLVGFLNRQIRFNFRIEKNKTCVFSIKKVWTKRWSVHSYRNCQPGLPRNQTSLQESVFCCQQVWYFGDQLRCVVHSHPIVGMTIARLFSLETCIVQIQIVRVNFACTKSFFNLWAEAIINVRIARLWARCAKFLSKIKQIPFSFRLIKGFTFLKRGQNQFESKRRTVQSLSQRYSWAIEQTS